MELTFDYQDIKEVLDGMGITINDVYFGVSAVDAAIVSPRATCVYMYWIALANQFNYYQDIPNIPYSTSIYLKIKGKWFSTEDLCEDHNDSEQLWEEKLAWLKAQKYVNCRYFVDGIGTSTIGANGEYPE